MMKGTIADIICSSPFEFHKTANDIYDINSVLYFLYGLLGYQNLVLPVSVKITFLIEPYAGSTFT